MHKWCYILLEGNNVNLRIIEREDLPVLHEWDNNPKFRGEYAPPKQGTQAELERLFDNLQDSQWFFIEKKDGAKVGFIAHFLRAGEIELGYNIVPTERRKGYASEAIAIMVDYLFLSKDTISIQAKVDPENTASWKALEKNGFKREGILRKNLLLQRKMERRLHVQHPQR
jgi:ribosomal-protein-alanine N-acetyltransferase